ncbi:hypothetical protein GCM10027280_60200 [Micromonospora polyrhachis]|uniref:Uncharacterized protein n=1 Tax=Micromonospora polyrhachis TaxID=1282883 RepID=A0A7W7SNW8_9ACTN|nr:hypothetical protein [Micromonospora polyrhachis]MBB4957881.1 hypothetical protein [Micromonospora polyrhachis]
MRPVQIVSGRHPFEIMVLVAALLCGILLIVTDIQPPSINIAMPPFVQATWELGLVLVGVGGLLGITWPGHLVTGIGIELGAMVLLGTTTAMYSIAVFIVSGRPALVAGAFIGAVAVSSLWRSLQILRDLRKLTNASEQNVLAEVELLVEGDDP